MNETQKKIIEVNAGRWLRRVHVGRTRDEKNAYLEALWDMFEAYEPGYNCVENLQFVEDLFFPEEKEKDNE